MTKRKFKIKEIYYTLQGEGFHAGRAAVFVRMSGCNLWTGRESDRQKAICKFCDTDFVGTNGPNGGTYTANQLTKKIKTLWPKNSKVNPFIVITGGEPMLQVNEELITVLHENEIEIAMETNGTIPVPSSIDWVCFSPKAGSEIVIDQSDEIKIVFPQTNMKPEDFADGNYGQFYLQPMDDEVWEANTKACIAYVKENPLWKLSVQTHKYLGIS